VQPVVSDEVAAALADIAVGAPANGTIEVAGPERLRLADVVRRALIANRDSREVIADGRAAYFGAQLNDQTLIPGDGARIGATRFADWLGDSMPQITTPKSAPSRSTASAT
jgi:uncharacterized protein YbjT (DUF2867 family)